MNTFFSAREPPSYNPPPSQRKGYKQLQQFRTLPAAAQKKTRNTWTNFSVADFLSLNPPQYERSQHKEDLRITTSKFTHFLLQFQTVKSYNNHPLIHLFPSDSAFFLSADQGRFLLKRPQNSSSN